MDISNVNLALDGLDEGFHYIAFELNSVLAIRCEQLQICHHDSLICVCGYYFARASIILTYSSGSE